MTSSRETIVRRRSRASVKVALGTAAFLLAFAGIGASAMATAPTNDTLPVISDTTPQDGQTISTTTGNWSGTVTSYAYQWQEGSTASGPWSNVGTNSASYTVSGCQQFIRVQVTASNTTAPPNSTTVDSAATSAVSCAAPSGGSASISGTQQVGNTLTGSGSGFSGSATITLSYAWYISTDSTCTSYSGTPYATGTTYALPESTPPWNRCIKLVVTATNSAGSTTAEAFTDNIDGIAPSFSVDPVASGIRRIGEQLFVLSNGTVDPGYPDYSGGAAVNYTYEWQQKCPTREDTGPATDWVPYSSTNYPANTPNETGTTYTLQNYPRNPSSGPADNVEWNYPGDIDCDIRVEVTATNGNDVTRTGPVSVGNNADEDSNARGRIQRPFGNTYQVETAVSFEDGADPGWWGQAPNLTDPTKPLNDCLGPYNWNDSTVTAPYVPTATATANAQEACRQLQQAVDQNLTQTIDLSTVNSGSPVNNASFAAPAQSQQNGFSKIELGPSFTGTTGGTFSRGALIQDFKNLLIVGQGEDASPDLPYDSQTRISGTQSGGSNTADVCDEHSEDGRIAMICVEDTDSFGQATNVSVRNMVIDGNNISQAPADYNKIYSAVGFQNASGAVHNVEMEDFDGPSTIGETGAGGRGIDVYRYATPLVMEVPIDGPECKLPERITTSESEFDEMSGPQAAGVSVEGQGCDSAPYSNTHNTVIARVQDGDFDDQDGPGILGTYDAKLLATDNGFDDGNSWNIQLGQTIDGSEAGPNSGSVIRDNDLDGDFGAPGITVDNQVQPDMAETVDAAQPIVIDGNEVYDSYIGISTTDGMYEVTGNEVYNTFLGVAVGPSGVDDLEGGGSCNDSGPVPGPSSVDGCDQTEVALNGNDITDFLYGIASTNDGIPGATDLSMEGNRVVSGYEGFEPESAGGGDITPQAGSYDGAIGLLNYYDDSWNPYADGGDPPAANQQVDPVDARNNWWGCNDGPSYNPDAEAQAELGEFGYCSSDTPPEAFEPTRGEVIIDGGIGAGGSGDSGGTEDQVQYSPYLTVEADAGDKILRAQASEVPIGGEPTGETVEFFMDLSENSSGAQKSIGLPPVEIQYQIPGEGDNPFVTDAALDRSFVDTNINTAIAPNYLTAGYETGDLPTATRTDYQVLVGVDDAEDGAEYSNDLEFDVIRPDPSLFSGAGLPPAEIGQPGDFWFDTETYCLYGPKGSQAPPVRNGGSLWPETCQSLWGGTVLNGSGPPSNAIGNPGDFYLDTSAEPECLYGPKGETTWPTRCIPIGGYPLPTVTKLRNQFTVNRAGQSIATVRVNCPALQVRCVVRSARVVFQARQNLNGVQGTARIGRTTIPAGESTVIRANVPGRVVRELSRQRTGSVTTTVRVDGAGTAVDISRRSGLRR